MEEVYDVVENIISKMKDLLEKSEDIGVSHVYVGPLISSKLRGLPALWIIPDTLSFESEEMHMDLYRYNVTILSLNKPKTILKSPITGAKQVSEAFKVIRAGFREDASTRAYVQNIRLQKLDYIGENIENMNLFITSCQISFLIRVKP